MKRAPHSFEPDAVTASSIAYQYRASSRFAQRPSPRPLPLGDMFLSMNASRDSSFGGQLAMAPE
eukprot:CAMPEP_0171177366 /NCGR_PEP_ID=MMETSP0790-20130122/12203_1 /TAXON_ID=2925 /ORGANISM="Alexandrium catenella, Strain OF101" /LENGTH=63 /DNA_ID=CAMNT_0011642263 /DNA_START=500 /DNA_END=691 /DNA_ORIENTATION=-